MKKVYFGKSVEITLVTDLIDNDMSNMFKNNSQIEYVYNIPYSVRTMENTFLNCTNLIHVGKLPSQLESANSTFQGCSIFNQSLEDLGFIDLKNLKSCKYIFSNNSKRGGIVSFPESVEDASYSFQNTEIKKIEFDINKNYKLTDLTYAFSNCLKLESCNLIPSTVAILNYCFYNSGINSLPNFSLSTTCKMQHTFEQTKLTIINRDLPKSILMDYCFANISTLTDVDGKYFHLVENYSSTCNLFYNCTNLTNITGVLENMGNCDSAFQKCSKLTSLSLTGVNSCQNFIRANDNTDPVITSIDKITFLSIKGRIVPCGPTILDNKKLGDFLNMSETDKKNDDSHKKIGNLIQLLKSLNGGKNVEVHISDADAPVSAMILQEMDNIISDKNIKYKLYLSSFDLNDYKYTTDNSKFEMNLTGTNDSIKEKGNITLPSHYWLGDELYKIVPSSRLFYKKDLMRVTSSLSKLSEQMFNYQYSYYTDNNLKEFIFLKTKATKEINEIPLECFLECPQVQFFNLDYLDLATIGTNSFYNSINQNIQFNSSKAITVNEDAFYRTNKNVVTLNLNENSSKKLDQSYYFEFPFDRQGKNLETQIHDSFLIKNQNLDEPIKDMLDKNVNIIKLINFDNIIDYIKSFTLPRCFEKKDGTIIDDCSDGFSIDKIDFTNLKKIYVLSNSVDIKHNNYWRYYNLYWLIFERVD